MKTTKGFRWVLALGVVALGVALVLGPNLFWLARSSVRIENRDVVDLTRLSYQACSQSFPIERLEAGESVFRVLSACGDDSLVILSEGIEVCVLYVEGDMTHVRAHLTSPREGECSYGSPPFAPLLIFELF